MHEGLKTNENPSDALRTLLRKLFESNRISSAACLSRLSSDGAVSYSLLSSREDLEFAIPLHPLMPANSGGVIGHLTGQCAFETPVAVVLRPCELRALVERSKKSHANLDNLILISYTCPGVLPLKVMREGSGTQETDRYWECVGNGQIPPNIRPTCKGCEEFIPYCADITIDVVGNGDLDSARIVATTEQGKEIIRSLDGEVSEMKVENDKTAELLLGRSEAKKELFEECDSVGSGLEGLIRIFGRCVRCHSCSTVCPVCSCNLCYFDSRNTEYERRSFESQMARKKGIRLPPDTILYQLGRMAHVGVSCVGCGQCADVCPVNIPVSTYFAKVGQAVQEAFDYVPGKDAEESLPVTTYKPEEFVEVGE